MGGKPKQHINIAFRCCERGSRTRHRLRNPSGGRIASLYPLSLLVDAPQIAVQSPRWCSTEAAATHTWVATPSTRWPRHLNPALANEKVCMNKQTGTRPDGFRTI